MPSQNKLDHNFNFKLYIDDEFKDINLKIEKAEETESVLCIDFGTSNTTTGTQFAGTKNKKLKELRKGEFNYVRFKNNTNETEVFIPTIMLTNDFNDTDKKFIIGYEAQKMIEEADFNPKGTIITNLKKLLNKIGDTQTLYDQNRTREKVKNSELVKYFIDYIIK